MASSVVSAQVATYPYAECGDITGPNHTFAINNNGYGTLDQLDISIFDGSANNVYQGPALKGAAANKDSHTVRGLPTDGRALNVSVWTNNIEGNQVTSCTAYASEVPSIYYPSPGSMITLNYQNSMTDSAVNWDGNGNTSITNYWLYMGTSLAGREIYNSGDLGTTTGVSVSGIPSNGKPVYARLWYSIDNGVNWDYWDAEYRTRNSGTTPYVTYPADGSRLGDGEYVTWIDPSPTPSTTDKYRVYAGANYTQTPSNNWTYSSNIAYDQRSYPINGWSMSDWGKKVWVRFQWRKGGVWKRSIHSYVAGYGPAMIVEEETRPVPPGQ